MSTKTFNSGSLSNYVSDEWTNLYTYQLPTNKSIILSLLIRNNFTSGITINAKIVDSNNNDVCIIIKDEILSKDDEFKIDRSKQFFVLQQGWSIKVKFSGPNILSYYSVLENIQ